MFYIGYTTGLAPDSGLAPDLRQKFSRIFPVKLRLPVAVVMRPKLVLLMLTFGAPQFGWLSTLMASIRNSRLFTSDILIRLLALMSKRSEEGPRK